MAKKTPKRPHPSQEILNAWARGDLPDETLNQFLELAIERRMLPPGFGDATPHEPPETRAIEGLERRVGFDLGAKEVSEMKIPKRDWIIPDMMCRPNLVNLYGLPFAGKTELLKALAVPLVLGGDFFGHTVVEPCGIFWANLDTEWDDTKEMYERWPAKVRKRVRVTDLHPADLEGGYQEWLDRFETSHREHGWNVAVIDTMAQLMRRGTRGQSIDEFKRDQVTQFLTPLRRTLAGLRIMGIIVNHARKPQQGDVPEMPSTGSFGSVAFGAMADMSMRLRRMPNDDAILDWQGRHRPMGRIDLHWSNDQRKFLQADLRVVSDLSAKEQLIVETVRKSKGGLTQTQLVKATGLDQAYVSKRLQRLATKGLLMGMGEGQGQGTVWTACE